MFPSAVAMGVAGVLCYATNLGASMITICALALYLSLGGSQTLWLIYRTLPRDVKGLYRYLRLLKRIHHAKRNNLSVPKIFQEVVRKNRNKVAFYFEDETWTFQQVDELSNKVGNYFAAKGVKHGDPVALFMENCVEYVCIWLGLTKIGAIPALINYNLRFDSLKHCINVAACKAVICGANIQAALAEARESDDLSNLPVYVFGTGENELILKDAVNMDVGIKESPSTTPPQIDSVNFSDKMVFIYTSGTTGMPKAAVIKHSRAYFAGEGMSTFIGLAPSDILYGPLPLYHTAGGILGLGHSLFTGGATVLKRKFSVSQFWSDCVKYRCTVAQYIGEICRYLLNTPEKPEDKRHNIRLMFGNGLRPNIWKDFQSRFSIPRISEFYGSTEGNANIINMDGKPGAVGFVSVLFPSVYPVALIKVDEDTREVVRDANGMCILCKPGEPGEFIGKIVKDDPVRDFHGYADDSATKKKIVRDVFKKGDYAFLSGDILMMDEEGYLYFKDRTGDTFRWKGENVSTNEVEAVISKVAGHADVVVYGVEVPGAEGRAGMAAILDGEVSLNLEELYAGVMRALASYARPYFVRIAKELEMTGTYKLKKIAIQKEGFNPNVIKDKIYFLDAKKKEYVPLTIDLYDKIVSGEVRF
ncbi:long-chain fatty acid transport protein 4 isoform X2 [Procambarus clarkii]|uniref:long-chain fatty acid transport protein 4 isoform X2 n=1 Tax=Procambarus clarkii TaxID=6728 RepID=UPI001E6756EE|nr:long-chain fatty acid transport protein 4-like isoform X3 [Procambarus clarkii]